MSFIIRKNTPLAAVREENEYRAHLSSPAWTTFKTEIFRQRGRTCEECGSKSWTLEVHHLHYKSLGHERPEDVKILCKDCHAEYDFRRRRRVVADRLDRAFETWFEKRTGMPAYYADECDREQFDEWIDNRD